MYVGLPGPPGPVGYVPVPFLYESKRTKKIYYDFIKNRFPGQRGQAGQDGLNGEMGPRGNTVYSLHTKKNFKPVKSK